MRRILSIAIALLLCACVMFLGTLAAADGGTAASGNTTASATNASASSANVEPTPVITPTPTPTSAAASATNASASSVDVEPTPVITPAPTSEAANMTASPTDIEPSVTPIVEPTAEPIVRPTVAPGVEPTLPPIGGGDPEPMAEIALLADGKSAVVAGDFGGLYARVALILDNGGVTGLYLTQVTINPDGTILVPEFIVPGLTVKGVNVALVPTLGDIQSSTPNVIVSAFMMYK